MSRKISLKTLRREKKPNGKIGGKEDLCRNRGRMVVMDSRKLGALDLIPSKYVALTFIAEI